MSRIFLENSFAPQIPAVEIEGDLASFCKNGGLVLFLKKMAEGGSPSVPHQPFLREGDPISEGRVSIQRGNSNVRAQTQREEGEKKRERAREDVMRNSEENTLRH